ncbi:MAG: sugar transferase [Ancrocorticia sp.]|uniref:sugar transferase n=1 Tax=Ancrocorticia sp. TaxID=2593684 RepID=UPI003F8FF406
MTKCLADRVWLFRKMEQVVSTEVSSGGQTQNEVPTALAGIGSAQVFQFWKRTMDIVVSIVAIIVSIIPLAIVAVAIKVDSPGPVFYCQERLGKGGRPFRVIKFRSMQTDAESGGPQWAEIDDPRVTRVGRFLRMARIDEVPQFLNVLMGDMSLVGPRPERGIFYQQFEATIPGFDQRLLVTPGMSGLAQISGGYDLSPEEKILLDAEYIRKRSVRLDLKILASTLVVVFTHAGAR